VRLKDEPCRCLSLSHMDWSNTKVCLRQPRPGACGGGDVVAVTRATSIESTDSAGGASVTRSWTCESSLEVGAGELGVCGGCGDAGGIGTRSLLFGLTALMCRKLGDMDGTSCLASLSVPEPVRDTWPRLILVSCIAGFAPALEEEASLSWSDLALMAILGALGEEPRTI